MIDNVLEIVRRKGPVLPIQISKETKLSTLFASANLSELVHYKKVFASHAKIGGSPLYYVEGQEPQLHEKLYNYLNETEKKAFDLLKEKKVLKDSSIEPNIKSGMKALKDFAKPLNVKLNGSSLLFWKWYLIEDNEVKNIVNSLLRPEEKSKKGDKPDVKDAGSSRSAPAKDEGPKPSVSERPKAVQDSAPAAPQRRDAPAAPEPAAESEEGETETTYSNTDLTAMFRPSTSIQTSLSSKTSVKLEEPVDDFYTDVKKFLNPMKIEIIEANMIKKNSEADLIINIPTPIGSARYYCKAKNKKKLSDGDLSFAFVQGQIRRLPVILISPGELSKKALEMITHELKGQVLFKRMVKADV